MTLDPTPPPLIRLRLRLRTQHRRARYALASLLARAARAVDPLPWGGPAARPVARVRVAPYRALVDEQPYPVHDLVEARAARGEWPTGLHSWRECGGRCPSHSREARP